MNKLSEEQLLAEIRLRLDRSIESLDDGVALRIDAARESAVSLSQSAQSVLPAGDESRLPDGVLDSLDDSLQVSPGIEKRLDQIRRQAMTRLSAQQERRRSNLFMPGLLERARAFLPNSLDYPLSMIASACLTVTVVSLFYLRSVTDPAIGAGTEEEFLLLASADDIELYENLDFYLWLEEIEQAN